MTIDADTRKRILRYRIYDCIVDGPEYPEEIYLNCSFRQEGHRFDLYATSFRLTQVLEGLEELERDGFVTQHRSPRAETVVGILDRQFRVTEVGRGEYFKLEHQLSSHALEELME